MALPQAFDLPCLLLMAAFDAWALAVLWQRRSTARVLRVLLAWLAAGLLLAVLLARDDVFLRLRLLAWLFFVHLPVMAGVSALVLRGHGRVRLLAGGIAGGLLLVAADAFVLEPHDLEISHVVVQGARVPRALRVALVADVQADHVGAYERRALLAAAATAPDLVLLAGDYVQAPAAQRARQVRAFNALLRELDFGAPRGAYAVAGDAEQGDRDWMRLFAGTRIVPLPRRTTLEVVPGVWLTALSLADSRRRDLRLEPRDGYRIVLGHAPDFALAAPDADLLLAGHTHGGQVRLPWLGPLMTLSAVPRAWASGVTRLADGSTLVVSRGIGMERDHAPRLRFRCRPQIVVIELQPAPGQ